MVGDFMTINMPVFGQITITPEKIIAGENYTVTAVVADAPVPVYEVSNYSDEIYSNEVRTAWQ